MLGSALVLHEVLPILIWIFRLEIVTSPLFMDRAIISPVKLCQACTGKFSRCAAFSFGWSNFSLTESKALFTVSPDEAFALRVVIVCFDCLPHCHFWMTFTWHKHLPNFFNFLNLKVFGLGFPIQQSVFWNSDILQWVLPLWICTRVSTNIFSWTVMDGNRSGNICNCSLTVKYNQCKLSARSY